MPRSSPASKTTLDKGTVESPMWFDSHCHLHLCDAPTPEVMERARRAGVLQMLTVGIDLESSLKALALTSERGVHAAVGVHPNSSSEWDDTMAAAVDELASSRGVVAVGETGLDYFRDYAPVDKQRTAFAAHVEIAKQRDKALVIHTRESVDDALDLVADVGPPDRFVFHCWSGDEAQLRTAVGLGAHISFAGNVSFSSAERLREMAKLVPQERLLVETDSPFLTPVPHRGEPNEPRFVSFVGVAVAEARGVSAHLLAEQTTQNAQQLFR